LVERQKGSFEIGKVHGDLVGKQVDAKHRVDELHDKEDEEGRGHGLEAEADGGDEAVKVAQVRDLSHHFQDANKPKHSEGHWVPARCVDVDHGN